MQTNSFLKIVPYVTTKNFNTNLLYLAALALMRRHKGRMLRSEARQSTEL
jgi:hypothetical protein